VSRAQDRLAGEPHARFEAWLLAGESREPPRDLALHASVCDVCRQQIAAFDLLGGIDPGRAPLPPSRESVRRPLGGLARAGRFAIAASGAILVATAAGFGAGQLIDLRGGAPSTVGGNETPGQEVLGGSGGPSATATPARTASPEPSPTASPSPTPPPLPTPVSPG
jgi:hypothetical protein